MARGDIRLKIRDILGAFMFGGEASDKYVKVLSGGERSRLAMIRLLLEPVNLLILDEPTNHLDMQSKDVLKQAIRDFDGTAIIVSHDRDFLDGLVEKVYEFGGGVVREHIGGIYDFLQKKQIESLSELGQTMSSSGSPTASGKQESTKKPAETPKTEKPVNKPSEKQKPQMSYADQKAHNRIVRKAEKEVADAEAEVTRLETAIKEAEQVLATPEGARDSQLLNKYFELKHQLEEAEDRWTNLSEELEKLIDN